MFRTCRFYFVIAFVCCLSTRVQGQTTGLSVDKDHMSGVAEAHLATLEGWRKGDVLIRYSTTGNGRFINEEGYVEGPDAVSVVVREDYLARFIFDLDSERTLVINRREREEQLFNALDEELQPPVILVDHRILLYDKTANLQLEKKDAGVISRAAKMRPFQEMLASMGVPDLRSWGCVVRTNWDFDRLRTSIEFNNAVHNIEQLIHVGGDVYRIIAKDLEGTRGFGGQYATDWDVKRNVPVKFVVHHVAPSEGSGNPVITISVKWKSMDGNFVPESSRMSRRSIRPYIGRNFHVEEETTTEVHWFSFNTELSNDVFDEKLLGDRNRLDELLNTDVFDDKPVNEPKDK